MSKSVSQTVGKTEQGEEVTSATTTESQSDSITIKLDSKGNYNYEAKRYGTDVKEIMNWLEVADTEFKKRFKQGGE